MITSHGAFGVTTISCFQNVRKTSRIACAVGEASRTRMQLLQSFHEVRTVAARPSDIAAGFENAGILPFNPDQPLGNSFLSKPQPRQLYQFRRRQSPLSSKALIHPDHMNHFEAQSGKWFSRQRMDHGRVCSMRSASDQAHQEVRG